MFGWEIVYICVCVWRPTTCRDLDCYRFARSMMLRLRAMCDGIELLPIHLAHNQTKQTQTHTQTFHSHYNNDQLPFALQLNRRTRFSEWRRAFIYSRPLFCRILLLGYMFLDQYSVALSQGGRTRKVLYKRGSVRKGLLTGIPQNTQRPRHTPIHQLRSLEPSQQTSIMH